MKQTLIYIILLIASTQLWSKPKHHPKASSTETILKGGLNLSNAVGVKGEGDIKIKEGFTVGLETSTKLDHHFFLNSGLFFQTKGTKYEIGDKETSINLMYLQIPIQIAYKYPLEKHTDLSFHIGPYFAYGIGGKIDPDSHKKENSFSKTSLKRFDLGMSVGIALEVSRIILGFTYERGLLNIEQKKHKEFYNQNFLIHLGFKIK